MKRKTNFVVFSFVCLGTMILASCGVTPHTHTFVEHGEVAATCTAPGNKKYFTCSAESCKDKIFDADKNETTAEAITIAALGHNFGAPTVTWNGSAATATAKCSRCTVSETETKTGTFVPESVATCVSKATGHYHVVFDKASFGSADSPTIEVGDYGPHHVHEVAGKAATCTEAGYLKHYECDTVGCGKLFADETATDEIHDLDEWKQGAGKINPLKHVTELVSGLVPTCVLPGYKDAYQCTVCRHYFEDQAGTKAIESLTDWRSYGGAGYLPSNPDAHSLVKVDGQAATCTVAGWKDYYQCERGLCSKLFEDELGLTPIADLAAWKVGAGKLNPIAHTTVEVPGKAASCTEDGYETAWKCSVCNQYFEEKAASTLIGDATAYGIWKLTDGAIAAHDHHDATLVPGQKETCIAAGFENAWTCKECGQYFSAESLPNDKLIGDGDAYNTWKSNGGKIDPTGKHSLGDLIPQVDATRTTDGVKAHYQCSVCEDYFDENGDEVDESDLVIKKSALTVSMEVDKSYDLPDIPLGGYLVVDVKLDQPGKACEFMLGDGWGNYIGYFKVSLDANGTYAIQDNRSDGVSYNMTEDGFFRMYIDQSKVTFGQNISSMEKYDLLYMRAPDDKSTPVSGTIVINPAEGVGGEITRGYKLKADSWKYLINGSYSHSLDEMLVIDVKFISGTKFAFKLQDDWGSETKDIQLNTDGTLVDQRNGVQAFKVEDADGYADGYYRIIINLAHVNDNLADGKPAFTKVNRITVAPWGDCEAYVDVDPITGFAFDPFYTIKGSATNTKIELRDVNCVSIRNGDGDLLLDKAVAITVKAEGGDPTNGSKVYFALIDADPSVIPNPWYNCGKLVLTFKDGKLTDRVMQGSGVGGKCADGSAVGNKWPKVVDNKDGTYTLFVNIANFNGDGWNKANNIRLFYGEPGIDANGVTSFSIDLANIRLVDKVS